MQPGCGCPVCARWSRAYIRHLVRVGEHTGPRLVTMHNLYWISHLVSRARSAVVAGRFDRFRSEIVDVWGGGGRGAAVAAT